VHARIDYAKTAPGALTAMSGLETYVHQSGLERPLLELVKLRASFMNGCAYCVDMHTKVARSLGETEQRLYAVSLWRECPYYSERERAALAWTEAITLVSADHVPDEAYDLVRRILQKRNWSISRWPLSQSTAGTVSLLRSGQYRERSSLAVDSVTKTPVNHHLRTRLLNR
jgi:AhpD family alkylhydroperoxidase